AITSDCGYMIRFHRQVAEAVNIPVIFSSLLQIPLIAATLGHNQAVGIICANRQRLTPDLLTFAGVQKSIKVVIRGMEDSRAFRGPILDETGTLDDTAIGKEVVIRAEEMVTSHPETGAILLECSNLPPYAHAVQKATGRPVFDFTTLINYMHHAFHRKPFSGIF
ncbi:MAG: aspartate/glutamate racemase family protein, partial [Deltaproteobacteria bacterium]|nr:aspartate/glutamate racemase family protein [Deltaproteobacteria bacterium]